MGANGCYLRYIFFFFWETVPGVLLILKRLNSWPWDCWLREKKCTTLKLRVKLYLADKLRTSSQDAASQIALKRYGERQDIQEFLQQRLGSQNFQRLPVINQKSRHIKLMNLVLFYVWESAKVWVHWNHSLDMNVSYLRAASCAFQSWESLKWCP